MQIEQVRIQQLVDRPSEGLTVELKRWLNPSEFTDKAKIVRACLGLRNRNGGSLVIGFDDKTLLPDKGHEPPDPKERFHVNIIQALLSKYASTIFEVAVAFGERDGVHHPVIIVPEGVKTPVAAKADRPLRPWARPPFGIDLRFCLSAK